MGAFRGVLGLCGGSGECFKRFGVASELSKKVRADRENVVILGQAVEGIEAFGWSVDFRESNYACGSCAFGGVDGQQVVVKAKNLRPIRVSVGRCVGVHRLIAAWSW